MEMVIVAVRDGKAEAFSVPIFHHSIGTACRGFEDEVKKDGSQLARHPQDYSLYVLGKFDDVSGEFKTESPKFLCSAADVLNLKDTRVSKV